MTACNSSGWVCLLWRLSCARLGAPRSDRVLQKACDSGIGPCAGQIMRGRRCARLRSAPLELVANLAQQKDVLRRRRRRGRRLVAKTVDLFEHDENDERQDQEIQPDGQEGAVREQRDASL